MKRLDLTRYGDRLAKKVQQIRESTDAPALWQGVKEALLSSVEMLVEVAETVARLEELDPEDERLQFFDPGFRQVLRRIVQGDVLPELFNNVARTQPPRIADLLMRLPIGDQELVADNKPLKIAEPSGSHRLLPVSEMTADQIKQVIDTKGTIRSLPQQITWLNQTTQRSAARVTQCVVDDIEIAKSKKYAVIGGVKISRHKLHELLGKLID